MCKKKLLSIYIPTYNRAKLLDLMLIDLLPQIKEVEDDIELVISNNCSEDNTEEIVKKYSYDYDIKYNKNGKNIGSENFMIAKELCHGEYCLILGDDDLFIRGKLPVLIKILKENSNIDYFFLNFALISIKNRNEIIESDKKYVPLPKDCFSRDFEVKEVNKWEQMYNIKNKYPSTMFAYLGSNLFRTSIWRDYNNILNYNVENVVTKEINNEITYIKLDYIFPHIKIVSTAMKGKKCYYIGEPVIAQGFGAQLFWSDWDVINILTINELYEYYKNIGISLNDIKPFTKDLMKNNGKYIAKILSNCNEEELKKLNVEYHLKSFSENNTFVKSFIKELKEYTMNFDERIYKEYSSGFFEGIISNYVNENKIIAIWGTGEITNSLLRNSKNIRDNVSIILDGNMHKHGQIYEELNKEIKNPECLIENPVDLIIIGSIKFEKEIINEIRNMKLKCDVIYSKGIINNFE